MTNKEIDKMLSMLDNKKLEELKKYLLNKKKNNIDILRQQTFEKYLTTNLLGLNQETIPQIYYDDKIQIFTNGASIYIINKNLLNIKSNNLNKEKNNKRTTAHRYKIVRKEEMDSFVEKIQDILGHFFFDVLSIKNGPDLINYNVSYYDPLYDRVMIDIFRKREIEIANILLNNPKFTIYNATPVLKGESDIGKCYILGCKRN